MPSVFVVPVYVELNAGFERAVATLESYLRRAGYIVHVGQPLPDSLKESQKDPTMAKSEEEYLLELWEKNICPNCATLIPDGARVGSGRRSEGGFCSLKCFGEYYQAELAERHKRRVAAAERHRNS